MIAEQRVFEITAETLAGWIDLQGPDRWWSVDGDPILMGKMSFPCPGDELADVLRKIGKPLVVTGKQDNGKRNGQDDAVRNVEQSVEKDGTGDRLLQLRWRDADKEWLLVEDSQTTESERTQ